MRLTLAFLVVILATSAAAEDPRRLFAFRDWAVHEHTLSSGTRACSAIVARGEESLSIWADGGRNFRLLLTHPEWRTAPVASAFELRIDARPGWRVSDALIEGDSLSVWLPGDAAGMDFLREVAAGIRLTLREDGGTRLSVSLLGSTAALGALGDCIDALPTPDAQSA